MGKSGGVFVNLIFSHFIGIIVIYTNCYYDNKLQNY